MDEYPEPYECACGDIDYWCEDCGYHGHRCPLDEEPEQNTEDEEILLAYLC